MSAGTSCQRRHFLINTSVWKLITLYNINVKKNWQIFLNNSSSKNQKKGIVIKLNEQSKYPPIIKSLFFNVKEVNVWGWMLHAVTNRVPRWEGRDRDEQMRCKHRDMLAIRLPLCKIRTRQFSVLIFPLAGWFHCLCMNEIMCLFAHVKDMTRARTRGIGSVKIIFRS